MSFRRRSGTRKVALNQEQLRGAHSRIASAKPETEEISLVGICRGVLLESWKFDFIPEDHLPMTGKLSGEITEMSAKEMLGMIDQRAEALFNVTRIRTQSGLGRPSYELRKIALLQLAAGGERRGIE